MNEIRMIVTDLDRTLLRSDKTISAYTADVLGRCRGRGVKIAFATARSENSCRRFIEIVDPDAVVSNGGALARIAGETVYSAMMDVETANRLLLKCLGTGGVGYITADTEKGYLVSKPVDESDPVWAEYMPARFVDFSKGLDCGVYKITVEMEDGASAYEIASEFPDIGVVAFSGEGWYRFADKAADKWNGVRALADRMGIDPGSIAAFGDDYGDVEMLRGCGAGVAVANAIDEAKAAAGRICGASDDDGVARWIEENVLARCRFPEVRQVDISAVIGDAGKLIRRAFATVAGEFGITEESCPSHAAFITDERLLNQLSGRGSYCFGLFEGDRLAGFAALARYGGGYEITRLAVAPEKRHLGYGRRLMDAAIRKAREIGLTEIGIGIVNENTVLKRWYMEQGFAVEGVKKHPRMPFAVCAMGKKL